MEELVDFSQITIGGVELILVVIGLMQFAKKLGLKGNSLVVVSFVALIVFGATSGAINEGLVPAAALPWIRVALYALGFAVYGLAAMGLYDVAKKLTLLPSITPALPPPGPEAMHRPLSGR